MQMVRTETMTNATKEGKALDGMLTFLEETKKKNKKSLLGSLSWM